ncbi:unnamed protein product [Prunus brigantina]
MRKKVILQPQQNISAKIHILENIVFHEEAEEGEEEQWPINFFCGGEVVPSQLSSWRNPICCQRLRQRHPLEYYENLSAYPHLLHPISLHIPLKNLNALCSTVAFEVKIEARQVKIDKRGRKIERKRTGVINTGTPSLMSMLLRLLILQFSPSYLLKSKVHITNPIVVSRRRFTVSYFNSFIKKAFRLSFVALDRAVWLVFSVLLSKG